MRYLEMVFDALLIQLAFLPNSASKEREQEFCNLFYTTYYSFLPEHQ